MDAYDESQDERYMRYLQAGYQANSSATNITVRVPPATPPVAGQPLVQGSLLIPGWIREHAADVLFEPGDEDEPSIVQCTLMALVKVSA